MQQAEGWQWGSGAALSGHGGPEAGEGLAWKWGRAPPPGLEIMDAAELLAAATAG